jgi:hypothetical protein
MNMGQGRLSLSFFKDYGPTGVQGRRVFVLLLIVFLVPIKIVIVFCLANRIPARRGAQAEYEDLPVDNRLQAKMDR